MYNCCRIYTLQTWAKLITLAQLAFATLFTSLLVLSFTENAATPSPTAPGITYPPSTDKIIFSSNLITLATLFTLCISSLLLWRGAVERDEKYLGLWLTISSICCILLLYIILSQLIAGVYWSEVMKHVGLLLFQLLWAFVVHLHRRELMEQEAQGFVPNGCFEDYSRK